MKFRSITFVAVAAAAAAIAVPEAAAEMDTAMAEMKSADGKDFGWVKLEQTPAGVLLTAKLKNMPAGLHAFHIHETGSCEAPFKSAGGHFNPKGLKHGIYAEGGKHAGDMPNIHVPENGQLMVEVLNPDVTLTKGPQDSLRDNDGAAVVIHAGGDDYKSDPAGAAGDRIACGVIK